MVEARARPRASTSGELTASPAQAPASPSGQSPRCPSAALRCDPTARRLPLELAADSPLRPNMRTASGCLFTCVWSVEGGVGQRAHAGSARASLRPTLTFSIQPSHSLSLSVSVCLFLSLSPSVVLSFYLYLFLSLSLFPSFSFSLLLSLSAYLFLFSSITLSRLSPLSLLSPLSSSTETKRSTVKHRMTQPDTKQQARCYVRVRRARPTGKTIQDRPSHR